MKPEEIQKKIEDLSVPLRWNINVRTYAASGNIPRSRYSNGYVATNLGTGVVRVNGQTLFPSATPATVAGDSVSMIGNVGEVFKGTIDLEFVVPTGATPLVEIVEKYYIRTDE